MTTRTFQRTNQTQLNVEQSNDNKLSIQEIQSETQAMILQYQQLKQRENEVLQKKMKHEVELEQIERELQELTVIAARDYGVNTIEALESKITEEYKKNKEILREFEESILHEEQLQLSLEQELKRIIQNNS